MDKILPEDCLPSYTALKEWMSPKNLQKVPSTEWKGHHFAPAFPAESVQYAYEVWTPGDNDILVASFPKTGTTWIREITRRLMYHGDSKALEMSKDFGLDIMYLEAGQSSKYKIVDNLPVKRRCFITHMTPKILNLKAFKENNMKILFLLRNPKDQFVSYYNFVKNIPYTKCTIEGPAMSQTWSEIFEETFAGKYPQGLESGEWYLDYLKKWFPHIKDKNVITVAYEDMINNPTEQVSRIAKHINAEVNDDVIDKIVLETCFTNMKKKSDDPGEDEALRHAFGLVRKGGIGGWKDYFTVAQSEKVDRIVAEKLADTNIKFIYD